MELEWSKKKIVRIGEKSILWGSYASRFSEKLRLGKE